MSTKWLATHLKQDLQDSLAEHITPQLENLKSHAAKNAESATRAAVAAREAQFLAAEARADLKVMIGALTPNGGSSVADQIAHIKRGQGEVLAGQQELCARLKQFQEVCNGRVADGGLCPAVEKLRLSPS